MAQKKYEEWVSDDNLTLLTAWARDGMEKQEMAKKIGISRKTLYEWIKKNSNIRDAIKRGADIVDVEVENAALKMCLGFVVTLEKPIKCKKITYDEKTGKKKSESEVVKKVHEQIYVQPVPLSQMFWLSHRIPDKWGKVLPQAGGGAGVVEIPAQAPEEKPPEAPETEAGNGIG